MFATLAPLAAPPACRYVTLVLTLTLMVGLLQLGMGLARLGALVNFISHTVIVGFTAGAGLLIIAAQLRNFFGIPVDAGGQLLRDAGEVGRALRHARPVDHVDRRRDARRARSLARRLVPRVPYMIVR